jgi:hypothetical protein
MRHDLALLVFSVWQNQVRLIEEIKVKYFKELVTKWLIGRKKDKI